MLCIIKQYKYKVFQVVKILIAALCLAFLFKKFNSINIAGFDDLIFSNLKQSWHWAAITLVLFFANWGIEAAKWKFLTGKIQNISFVKSFGAVMGGVAISSFTPNRTGEFAGRMIFLENKLDPGIIALTIFGSISQLMVTLLAGLPGFYIFISNNADLGFLKLASSFVIFVLVFLLILVLLIFNLKKMIIYSKKLFAINEISNNIANALLMLNVKDVLIVFSLSVLRYFVFLLQFIFLLIFFDITLQFWQYFTLLPAIFLIQTLIPTFILSEIGIRISVAITVLSHLGFDEKNIIASSSSLWVINIMLAAIVGILAIQFLKFKTQK